MSAKKKFVKMKSKGGELRACRGCLATDLPLFDLRAKGLAQIFSELIGVPVLPTDTYPQHVCVMCKHLLSKFFEFRLRCHSAMYVIQQMVEGGIKVSTESLSSVDKGDLKINLITTDVHVVSLADSEKASTNNFHIISNGTPANAGNNPALTNKDSDNDGKSDEITDSIDNDNNISSVLSESDEWPSDSELQTKRIQVNKENVICKRPITAAVIEDLVDNDNNVISVLSESDEWPSDSELPTKRKRVNKENVTSKRLRKTKNEGADEEQDIIMLKSIGYIFKSARLDCRGGSYISFWEKVYQESLKDSHEPLDYKDLSQWTLTQKINQYIYSSKKLATLYNCELKFSCLADQKKEIEDRRSSEMYQNARFKCEYCCKHYNFEETYKRHMVSHDPKSGNEVCEICMYRFKSQKSVHYLRCHTKSITCKTCGVVNRTWKDAGKHFKWHGGAAGIVCDICGKHFAYRKLYLCHRMQVHRTEFGTTPCLLCGDTFHGANGLKKHMSKWHKEMRRHTARQKGTETRSRQSETATISGRKQASFMCELCGGNFNCQSALCYHQRIHTGEKPYECDLCHKRFRLLYNLKKHMVTHTDARPYKCPHCPKAFRTGSNRDVHIRTHTKERPFKCDICSKRYVHKPSLKEHIDTVHRGLPPSKKGKNKEKKCKNK